MMTMESRVDHDWLKLDTLVLKVALLANDSFSFSFVFFSIPLSGDDDDDDVFSRLGVCNTAQDIAKLKNIVNG